MIVIPINGQNERMGQLFSTPKHNLLYEGVPAIKRTVQFMQAFGEVTVIAGEKYFYELQFLDEPINLIKATPTENVIDTIKQARLEGELFIVDCDVVPLELTEPVMNTVYCFENKEKLPNYSNYFIKDGRVVDCNEKGFIYPHAGAGIYYFKDANEFLRHSHSSVSVSQVFQDIIHSWGEVEADTGNEIFRLGTLPDIVGSFTGNRLVKSITKYGKTVTSEVEWYQASQDKGDIPQVMTYNDDSIILEFIEQDDVLNIYKVFDIIRKYSAYKPLNLLGFDDYYERISCHLRGNNLYNSEKLLNKLSQINLPASFSHGDLSVKNIIPTSKGLKLIDPLYSKDRFGCAMIDCAKFLFSLKFYDNDIPNFNLFQSLVNCPKVLIASECVRVATYNKKFDFIAENLINEL